MSYRHTFWLGALGLLLLTGGLRFYRLGDWPFHGDELAALEETRAWSQPLEGAAGSQGMRLPRLIPLSYAVHGLGLALFGAHELGTRVLPALLGTLQVLLVFIGLYRLSGPVPALATALLLALWPEHLYRSQENRFYMTATLLATLCMLAGACAVKRRSAGWMLLACTAAFAGILTHTLEVLLLPGLFLGVAAAAWAGGGDRVGRLLAIIVAAGLVAAGFLVVYLLPLLHGWNAGETWGYSIGHSVLASVSQLGWPVALLAALGACSGRLAATRGSVGDNPSLHCYWLAWAALWAGAGVILPRLVTYHPAYVFPLSLGVLVLAGQAVALVFEALRQRQALAAYVWLGLACLLNFPGLISHYADGSRFDLRSAAQHIELHWHPGDRVGTFSPRLLRHYAADGIEPIGIRLSNPLADLSKLARAPERLWIVVPSSRAGKPEELAGWLGKHCSLEMTRRPRRLDYYDNTVEVYLYEPTRGEKWVRND